MRPCASKIFTLALTVFLLLSFSLSAFALPIRYWLATRDLDEQPYPQAYRHASYFVVIKTSYGIIVMPVFVKSNGASTAVSEDKTTPTSLKNEAID